MPDNNKKNDNSNNNENDNDIDIGDETQDNDNNNNDINDNNNNNNNFNDSDYSGVSRLARESSIIEMDNEGHILTGPSLKKLTELYLKGGLGKIDSGAHKRYMDMCRNIYAMAPPRKRAKHAHHASLIVCLYTYLLLHYIYMLSMLILYVFFIVTFNVDGK